MLCLCNGVKDGGIVLIAVFQQLNLIAFTPAIFINESPHSGGMIGQMSPVTQRQRRWGTGIRVFHIDPVQTQQGKLHRKRPRRATVGAGKNLVKAGPSLSTGDWPFAASR